MSAPTLTLTMASTNSDRDSNLKYNLSINLNGFSQENISSITLMLNDESLLGSIEYINVPVPVFDVSGNATVEVTVSNLINGREYTARGVLESNNAMIYKSNTISNEKPFTIPSKPTFVRSDPSLLAPLVDYGFNLALNLGNDYSNGGSDLTHVKFIWSRVGSTGDGMIDVQSFVYNAVNNSYIIDLSGTMDSLNGSDDYEISCVVKNLAGNSVVSDRLILNATNVPNTPPALTAAPDHTRSSSSSAVFRLSWTIPSDYTTTNFTSIQYRAYYGAGSDASNVTLSSTSALLTDVSLASGSTAFGFLTLNDPSFNQTVYMRVQAVNINGGSGLSPRAQANPFSKSDALTVTSVFFGPRDNDVSLNPVSSASAPAGIDGSGDVVVNFSVPPKFLNGIDARFVRFEVYKLDASNTILATSTTQSVRKITVNTATNYVNQSFAVRAITRILTDVNTQVESVNSNSLSGIPFTFPGAVSNLAALPDDRSMRVEWNANPLLHPDFVNNYRVEIKRTSSPDASYQLVTNTTSLSVNIPSLSNFVNYTVRVRAYFVVNNVEYLSAAATATGTPEGSPVAVTGFYAYVGPRKANWTEAQYAEDVSLSRTGDRQIFLFWDSPSDASLGIMPGDISFNSFQIYDASTNLLVKTIAGIPNRNVTSAILTSSDGISNGVNYKFKIRANTVSTRQTLFGAWSNDTSIVNPFTFPSAPTNLTSEVGDQQMTLNWTQAGVQFGTQTFYNIDVSGGANYDISDVSSAIVTNLVNDVVSQGKLRTVLQRNDVKYYSAEASWAGVTFSQPVITFTLNRLGDNEIVYDISLVSSLSPYFTNGLSFLNTYNRETGEIVAGYPFGNTPGFTWNDVSTVSISGVQIMNGITYDASLIAQFNYDDGFGHEYVWWVNPISVTRSLFNLVPYGAPIIDASNTIIGFSSGDILVSVNPNGRALNSLLVVGIPDQTHPDWNYVFNAQTLPTEIIGYQNILLHDPHGSERIGSAANLEKVYIFASNLRGQTAYNEVHTDDYEHPDPVQT